MALRILAYRCCSKPGGGAVKIAQFDSAAQVAEATRRWLEKAVIGLDLCPFAAGAYFANRVRFQVREQESAPALLQELSAELRLLQAQEPAVCETTLLIHPRFGAEFLQFNDFLAECAALIAALGLEGELQIASFHPQYQFAGTRPGDIENYTNRSPYPTLHLLREASIERAVLSVDDPADIYRRNILTMRSLGHEGWRRLFAPAGAAPRDGE